MKTALKKETRFGDVKFVLSIDMPDSVPQDDFNRYCYEFGHALAEAMLKKS